MAESPISWISTAGVIVAILVGLVGVGVTLFGLPKQWIEFKSLRGRHVKEQMKLIAEAGRRFEREVANAWSKGSFEDSLAKDLLVSHIFDRSITWTEWIEIRKFLLDHDEIHLELLRRAWSYRDRKQLPRVSFRMRPVNWLYLLCYILVTFVTGLFFLSGYTLTYASVNPVLWDWLRFFLPGLPNWLISGEIRTKYQLLLTGGVMAVAGLLPFIYTVTFFYGPMATFRIWIKSIKPTKPTG